MGYSKNPFVIRYVALVQVADDTVASIKYVDNELDRQRTRNPQPPTKRERC